MVKKHTAVYLSEPEHEETFRLAKLEKTSGSDYMRTAILEKNNRVKQKEVNSDDSSN